MTKHLSHEGLVSEFHKTTKKSNGVNTLEMIVLHYTAGTFAGDVASLSVGERSVSTQFVVSPTGRIAKIGNCEDILWHAGKSKHGDKTSLNKHSIGIELSNIGILTKSGTEWISHVGGRYSDDEVVIHKNGHNAFVPYPPAQLKAAFDLSAALIIDYPSIKFVVGHEEIATPRGRKVDPGNNYIMPASFYNRLGKIINEKRLENSGPEYSQMDIPGKIRVDGVKTSLNIRYGPGVTHKVFATAENNSVHSSTGVSSGSWVQIELDNGAKGWMHKSYIKTI